MSMAGLLAHGSQRFRPSQPIWPVVSRKNSPLTVAGAATVLRPDGYVAPCSLLIPVGLWPPRNLQRAHMTSWVVACQRPPNDRLCVHYLADRLQLVLRYDVGDSIAEPPDPVTAAISVYRVQRSRLQPQGRDGKDGRSRRWSSCALFDPVPDVDLNRAVQTAPGAPRGRLEIYGNASSDGLGWRGGRRLPGATRRDEGGRAPIPFVSFTRLSDRSPA